ncbi:MAG TPA: DUF374 domain-containing protein [Steroidobacteraceae bacterium]|jgi:lysophospholipid acyltransferase (LPLAT)-like uncharacterized protein
MGFVIAAVSKYRMDNVPLLLQPLFIVYGYGVGLAQFAYHCLIHWTCRIRYEGAPPAADRNVIYCLWHGDLQSYFCVFLRHRRHSWMIHPSWYMKPIHVCMRLGGIDRMILGSTGHGGRAAAEQLVRELRDGRSTGIAPDGPGGPARVPKRGVFHIAAQSGVPIVPLRFTLSRAWHLPTWDRKRLPQPFSTIHVRFGAPICVDESNFESAIRAAAQGL